MAYAWYWMQTGDTVERDHGDLLFQHAFDDPEGGYSWSGKQFSQEFEFSFDFVRYRQGLTTFQRGRRRTIPIPGPMPTPIPRSARR